MKSKSMKNKIKLLFVAVLMLASALLISAGDIIFKAGNLDISNNLAVNTDALYVDSANKKVGVGTTSPDYNMHLETSSGNAVFNVQNTAAGDPVIVMKDGTDASNSAWSIQGGGTLLFRYGANVGAGALPATTIMSMATDGKVGIGTTSPTEMLTLGAGNIKMNDGNAVVWGTGSGGTEFQTGNGASHTLSWYTNVTLRMRVNGQGNVGIGTASPSQKLDVAGYVKGTGLCIGSDCRTSWPTSISSQWTTSGTNIYYDAGNVGIGTTSPAAKLHVAGVIKATAFKTGDIFFNKDDKPVWRMFEDEDGLYVESLTTGKVYSVMLKEISAK